MLLRFPSFLLPLLVLALTTTTYVACQQQQPPSPPPQEPPQAQRCIAIIGAGIGGSATAYFLRSHFDADSLSITVYEREPQRVGGRVENVSFLNTTTGVTVPLEIGASILYSGNKILMDMIRDLNLSAGPPVFNSNDSTMGIWDGKRLVFQSSPWDIVTLFRIVWRYRWPFFKLRGVVKSTLKKFEKVYDLLAITKEAKEGKEGAATITNYFATPQELWEALGLVDLTQVSIRDYLQEQGIAAPDSHLVTEFVGAVNRVNYNSNNNVNALCGLVSLCPTVTGEVVSVKEGNAEMALAMLKAAEANLRPNITVGAVQVVVAATALAGDDDKKQHKYRLLGEDGAPLFADESESQLYDAVIIATPFAFSQLTVVDAQGQSLVSHLPPNAYVTTHATFVEGQIQNGFFGPSTLKQTPDTILVQENATVPISSLSLHIRLNATHGIYKLFSSLPLEAEFINSLFEPLSWQQLHHREWKAYPQYSPADEFTPFVVLPEERVFYVNALETAVSAMEISAIAAKNVAGLVMASFEEEEGGRRGKGESGRILPGIVEEKEEL